MKADDMLITVRLTTAEQLTPAERARDNLPETGLVVLEYTLSKEAMKKEFEEIAALTLQGKQEEAYQLYMKYLKHTTESACNLMKQEYERRNR